MRTPRTPVEGALQVLSRQQSAGDKPSAEPPHVAFSALARALPLSPDDAALHLAAQNAAERADALESYVEAVTDLLEHFPARTKAFLHRTLAAVHETRLRNRASAIEHFRLAADCEPEDLDALSSPRRLHVEGAEWAALADVLERIADAAPETSQKLTSWREAAIVHEQMLRDDESAAKCWRRIAEQMPTDRDAVSALDRLYTAQDAPEGLAFALEIARSQSGDSPRDRELAIRLARVKARLGALGEAITLCRDVLMADPRHDAAREALEGWVEQPGPDGAAALEALDRSLVHSSEHSLRVALRERRSQTAAREEQAQLASQIMEIADLHLGQKPQAFMAGLKALALGSDRVTLLPTLARLARETNSVEELSEAIESSLEPLPSGHAELPVLLRHAAELREALGHDDAATQLWNDLLAEAPEDSDALEGLARLYLGTGDLRNLSEVYARQARAARDPNERQAILLKAAAAHEQAGDDEAALSSYRDALELADSADALAGLDRLLERAHRFDEQAEVLLRRAASASSGDASRLRTRRGLCLERAGRAEAAALAYAGALALAPSDDAIAGLERLLLAAEAQDEAARALETVYRQRADLPRLADVLEIRIRSIPRSELGPLLDELASIYQSLGNLRLAFAARLRSFAHDPEDDRIRTELERLALDNGWGEELMAAYEDQLDRGATDSLAADLWRTIASTRDTTPGSPDLALAAWEEALRRQPGRFDLLVPLAGACRKAKAFGKLSEVLPQLIALEPSVDSQVDHLYELAHVAEEALENRGLAAKCYKQILKLLPGEQSAFDSLALITEDDRDYRALAALLENALQRSAQSNDDERRHDLELRLARLKRDRLGEPEDALTLLQQILWREPRNPGALAALEEMAFSNGPVRTEAARILEPILEESGRHLQLVQLLEAKVLAQNTRQERAATLRRIAEIRAGALNDPEMGFLAAARGMRELPDERALELCASLGTQAEAREELCSLLEEVEPAFHQISARIALCRRLAPLQEALGQSDHALASWRRLLALLPSDGEASKTVERLLSTGGRPDELCLFLQERSADASEPKDRIALLGRLATAQEAAAKPELAIETLRAAFALGEEGGSLIALDSLLGRLGRLPEQAEVLARLAAWWDSGADASEPEERREDHSKDCLLRRARILETGGDLHAALSAHEEILRRWPEEPSSIQGIERMFRARPTRSRCAALLEPRCRKPEHARLRTEVLELLLESADRDERLSLLRELSNLYEQLGEVALAFSTRLRLFDVDPENDEARHQLEQSAEKNGRIEELVAAYRDRVERAPNDSLSMALRGKMAIAYTENLNQPALAVELWEEIARRSPSDIAPLAALAQIYRQATNFEHLTRVLIRQVAAERAPEAKVELLSEVARIAEEVLGDLDLAANAHRQILDRLPGNVRVLQSLHRVLESSGQFAELAAVMEQELRIAEAGGASYEVRQLELRLGLLESGPLNMPERAIGHLEKTLHRKPEQPEAISALESIAFSDSSFRGRAARVLESVYRQRGQPRALVSALEAQIPQAASEQRWDLLDEIARVRESLRELPLAFAARLRAFAERPAEARLQPELHRLAEATGLFEQLADAYEETLALHPETNAALELWRTVAEIRQQLGRPEATAKAWEQVLRRAPGDRDVLQVLAKLYRQCGAARELARIVSQQVDLEPVLELQVEMLLDLARLAQQVLSDQDLAIRCCKRILERIPEEWRAIQRLDQLLIESSRYAELSELLTTQIQLADKRGALEEGLDLRVRLARIRHSTLNDGEGALELARDVLSRRSGHPGAIETLEEVMRSGSAARGRAASLLVPLYQESGAHSKEVEALEALVATQASSPERLTLLHRIADLHSGPLGSPRNGFAALSRALREAPDDVSSLEKCVAAAEQADASADLARVLEEIEQRTTARPARLAVNRVLGYLLEREGRVPAAAESWKRILHHDPANREALDNAARIFEKQQRWPELLAVLEQQLHGAVRPDDRCALLSRIGALQAGALADPKGALASCRAFLELRPDDPAGLESAGELCQRLEQWPELADILARRIRLQPASSDDLKLRLANICDSHLGDRRRAVQLYAGILENSPDHAAALSQLARIAEDDPRLGEAAEVLLRAYRRNGNLARLSALLEAQAESARAPEERKALWIELAELRAEKLQSTQLAFAALARALREDPSDAQLRARAERTADEVNAHPAWVAALEEMLPLIPAGPDAAEVCLSIGSSLELKLDDADRAIEFYERARRLFPQSAPRALAGLERLLAKAQRWAELREVLEALETGAPDAESKIEILLRIGELADRRLDDPDRAIAAYQAILDIDGANVRALHALEVLHDRSGRAEELFAVLDRLRGVASGGERERVRIRMAEVADEGLWDGARAMALYREVLADNPLNERAFDMLSGLLERGQRHGELKDLIHARIAVTVEPRALGDLHHRLGDLLFRSMAQPLAAVPHYHAAVERDATRLGSLEALRLIHEQLDRKEDLVQVLGALAPLQPDARSLQALRIRLAEVLVALERRGDALAPGRLALDSPVRSAEELDRLRALFISIDAYPEAVRSLDLAVEAEIQAGQPQRAVALLFELASLLPRVGNAAGAGPIFERILEIDPSNRSAYDLACKAHQGQGAWSAYAQVLASYLPHLPAEERIAALDALSRVQEEKLGRKGDAFRTASEALRLRPEDPRWRDRLERLAGETGADLELSETYASIADGLPRGPLAEQMYLVVARVQDERLDQVDAAERTLAKILDFDPVSSRALDCLDQMLARRGMHEKRVSALKLKLQALGATGERKQIFLEMARILGDRLGDARQAAASLERALELSTDPRERLNIQLEIAEIYQGKLGDDEAAARGFRQALQLDPACVEAFHALEKLHASNQRYDQLLWLYEQRLSVAQEPEERVRLLFVSAELWEARCQNRVRADACLEAVLQIHPQDLRAIAGLKRLRRAEGSWEGLAAALQREIQATADPAARAQLHLEQAEIFRDNLSDQERSAASLRKALELEPRHRPAIRALAALHEQGGRFPLAIQMLENEAELETNARSAAEVHHRIGRIR